MYHVGIQRRFFPGFRKVRVLSHGVTDGRLIINFEDGSQENYTATAFRVYNDARDHYKRLQEKLEREKAREHEQYLIEQSNKDVDQRAHEKALAMLKHLEDQRERQAYNMPEPIKQTLSEEQKPGFAQEEQNEVLRRATKRVQELFA